MEEEKQVDCYTKLSQLGGGLFVVCIILFLFLTQCWDWIHCQKAQNMIQHWIPPPPQVFLTANWEITIFIGQTWSDMTAIAYVPTYETENENKCNYNNNIKKLWWLQLLLNLLSSSARQS